MPKFYDFTFLNDSFQKEADQQELAEKEKNYIPKMKAKLPF